MDFGAAPKMDLNCVVNDNLDTVSDESGYHEEKISTIQNFDDENLGDQIIIVSL